MKRTREQLLMDLVELSEVGLQSHTDVVNGLEYILEREAKEMQPGEDEPWVEKYLAARSG